MSWITALLAFATTMLFFAIVVSIIVEMIHRFFRMRENGLHTMLQNYFKLIVQPSLETDDPGQHVTPEAFARTLVHNRAIDEPGKNLDGALAKIGMWISKSMAWLTNAGTLVHMPVEIFMERLASSAVFRKDRFLDDAGKQALEDFGQKFVALGAEMSDAFERRARFFSVIIAMVVAFIFFVHPHRLAMAYLHDDTLAAEVAALADDLVQREQQLAALRETAADGGGTAQPPAASPPAANTPPAAVPDTAEAPATAAPPSDEAQDETGEAPGQPQQTEQALPDAVDAAGNAVPGGTQAIAALLEGVHGDLNRITEMVGEFQSLGTPIGYPGPDDAAHMRQCFHDVDPSTTRPGLEAFCWSPRFERSFPSLPSIFWLILGGLLVGLGSPFWVKVIGVITPTKDVAGKIKEIVSATTPPGLPHADPAAVKAFRAADANRR